MVRAGSRLQQHNFSLLYIFPCRTTVELQLIRLVQEKEAAAGKARTFLQTAYGPAHIKQIREREVDGTTVKDLHVSLPYGDAFLALDALSGNPIRFQVNDPVKTPFGPGRVLSMRLTDDTKMYEVAIVNWILSGGDFAVGFFTVRGAVMCFLPVIACLRWQLPCTHTCCCFSCTARGCHAPLHRDTARGAV
jgi:hypothetical protein